MLVITDGQDTASTATLDEVLRSIRESELLVYPIGISPLTYAQTKGSLVAPLPPKLTVQSKRDEVDLNVIQPKFGSSGVQNTTSLLPLQLLSTESVLTHRVKCAAVETVKEPG